MDDPRCEECNGPLNYEYECERCCPSKASDCSAADGGAIGCGGEAGNPKRSADRPAKLSVFCVEAENVTSETLSSILRTLADHLDRKA